MLEVWPVAIYLETTVLRALPIEISEADFLGLKSLCEQLGIPILAPDLCVSELIQKRKRDVQEALRKARSSISHVGKYLDTAPGVNWGRDEEGILADVEARVRNYLNNSGLIIIPTPNIPLDTLLDMAVRKIPPFEEKGEKGFRDSVILFTVLERAKAQAEGYHILVSNDGIFEDADVMAMAKAAGVDLRVAKSVPDAAEQLRKFASEAMREFLEMRSRALMAFLKQHTGEIEQYISKNGEFTSSFLLSEERPFASLVMRIQGIEDAKLLDIVNAQPSLLPAGTPEGRVEISFGAKMKFALSIRIVPPPPGPTFRVEAGAQPPAAEVGSASSLLSAFLITATAQDEQLSRQEVTKTVSVSGSAYLKEPGEYSDLELHSVSGSTFIEALMGAAYKAK